MTLLSYSLNCGVQIGCLDPGLATAAAVAAGCWRPELVVGGLVWDSLGAGWLGAASMVATRATFLLSAAALLLVEACLRREGFPVQSDQGNARQPSEVESSRVKPSRVKPAESSRVMSNQVESSHRSLPAPRAAPSPHHPRQSPRTPPRRPPRRPPRFAAGGGACGVSATGRKRPPAVLVTNRTSLGEDERKRRGGGGGGRGAKPTNVAKAGLHAPARSASRDPTVRSQTGPKTPPARTCMCVRACVCTCVCACVFVCVHACVHVYMHVCMCRPKTSRALTCGEV